MNQSELSKLRERADLKLRFAEIYLKELESLDNPDEEYLERAHQESFLYHLLCAKDAFIQELNVYYTTNLPIDSVSPGKIRKSLDKKGLKSQELQRIYTLENDDTSWLFDAKEMRDHSTHLLGVPNIFYEGGENNGEIHLKNPKTRVETKDHYIQDFRIWHSEMIQLLNELRKTAIEINGL